MKRLFVLLLALVLTLSFTLPVFADEPTANLMTYGVRNPTDYGDLNLICTADGFNVQFNMDDPWELVDTHVYLGSTPPGQSFPRWFPFEAGDIPFETGSVSSVFIAAQAVVRMQAMDRNGNPKFDRRGNPVYIYGNVWAKSGNDIRIRRGAKWATYFEYVLQTPS